MHKTNEAALDEQCHPRCPCPGPGLAAVREPRLDAEGSQHVCARLRPAWGEVGLWSNAGARQRRKAAGAPGGVLHPDRCGREQEDRIRGAGRCRPIRLGHRLRATAAPVRGAEVLAGRAAAFRCKAHLAPASRRSGGVTDGIGTPDPNPTNLIILCFE